MRSKKLYFWQALLIIYVIPVIALTILVSCVDSPRFTSIMNKLASTDNYPSLIFNLIDFGVIIFAFMHYYRLPLALGGGGSAVKPQRGQFILLCLLGVFDILFFESFAVLTGGRQGLDTSLPHILSAIISAPIVEEMFYRHVLLRLFLRTYRSPLLAILYSAILFTIPTIKRKGNSLKEQFQKNKTRERYPAAFANECIRMQNQTEFDL